MNNREINTYVNTIQGELYRIQPILKQTLEAFYTEQLHTPVTMEIVITATAGLSYEREYLDLGLSETVQMKRIQRDYQTIWCTLAIATGDKREIAQQLFQCKPPFSGDLGNRLDEAVHIANTLYAKIVPAIIQNIYPGLPHHALDTEYILQKAGQQ